MITSIIYKNKYLMFKVEMLKCAMLSDYQAARRKYKEN